MKPTPNLLRRTLALVGAFAALAFAHVALAQSVTLKDSAGNVLNNCNFGGDMTVTPSGGLLIVCQTGTTTNAVFGFQAGSPSTLNLGTSTNVTVTRAGGTGSIDVGYTVSGGCTPASGTLTFAETDTQQTITGFTAPGAAGSCAIALSPASGTGPAPLNISIVDPNAPPPPTNGCPAIPTGSVSVSLPWGQSNFLTMKSGAIGYFPVSALPPGSPKHSIAMQEVVGTFTPASISTEMSVSHCPGVIDTSVPGCYKSFSSSSTYLNTLTIYLAAYGKITSQASLFGTACWAPASEGPWYFNLRWNYPGSGGGFVLSWGQGSY